MVLNHDLTIDHHGTIMGPSWDHHLDLAFLANDGPTNPPLWIEHTVGNQMHGSLQINYFFEERKN
jgi:hypothetical protein